MDAENKPESYWNDNKSNIGLFHNIVKGGTWVVSLRILTQLLSIVRYIILANMIGVTNMGLLGIAMLMIEILNIFTKTGFQTALIQQKKDIDSYLSTAWTVGIIRAVVLFAILYFAAPYAAGFKVPPEKVAITVNIIRVIGITLLITAFSNIGTVYFQKELQFHKQFLLRITGTFTDAVITIIFALVYKNVWALVIGRLAGVSVNCVMSYLLSSYKPAIKLDIKKTRKMWNFGKWIFTGSILGFILTQGDDLFVWSYLGISALALYQMAYKFSSMPATEITNVISQVTFPAYSKLQDETPRLKDAYLKVLQFTAFLSVPTAGLIFILARDFVTLFLKEDWISIIPVLQIISLKGLINAVGATRAPLFNAIGRPGINTKLLIAKVVMLIILIYPLTNQFNIVGTAITVTIISVILQPFGMFLAIRIIQCKVWEMLKPITFPVLATVAAIGAISLLKCLVFTEITILSFFVLGIVGGIIYIASTLLLDRFFGYGMKKILLEQLRLLCT